MLHVVLLFLALISYPQQPQAASPQMGRPKPLADATVEKCTIEGKVTSSADGAPLKKATVSLMPQMQPGAMIRPITATTDGDGKFLFRDVDSARYTLNVVRNGYARQNYGARTPNGPGTTLALVPGQHLKDVNVRLIPGAAINGRIVDEDGDPVASASVSAMRWSYMQGKRQLFPFGFSQTDDRGQYRIYGLAPGRYFISATFRGMFPMQIATVETSKESEEAYAPTYYPGSFDTSQATAVEVKPGDDIVGIVFRLSRVRAVRVSGTVRGPDGDPMKSAMVQLVTRGQAFSGMDMQMKVTDDKGTFTFPGVMPGAYVALVRGTLDQQQVFGRADIDVVTSPVDNVVIQAGSGAELEAEVRLDGAVDLSKATVRLSLSPAPDEPMFVPGSMAEIKDAGAVSLTRVYDGNYIIRAAPLPGDAYVSKAVFDDKDVLDEGLKIRGGGGHLDVTISASGAHLEGSVVDKAHQPFAGAQVVLVPEESRRYRRDLFRTASSDQYGHFVIRGVPPGTYKLFAWEAIDPGAYMDTDFLKANEDQGKTVQLSAGDRSTPELMVIPSAKTGE